MFALPCSNRLERCRISDEVVSIGEGDSALEELCALIGQSVGGSKGETVKDGVRIEAREEKRVENNEGQRNRTFDQSAISYSRASVTMRVVLFLAAKSEVEDEVWFVR